MKATLVSVALFFAAAAAQSFTVNTPVPNPPVCQPVMITWTGGTPPYFLDFGTITDGTSFRWVVNEPVGTSLGLDLRDNTGTVVQSGTFSVASGPDTSCIGASSSGSGSSSAGASTGSTTAGATSSGTVSVTTSTSVSVTSSSPSSSSVTASGATTTSAGTAGATSSGTTSRASSSSAGTAASSAASSASSSSQSSSASKTFAEMSAAGLFGVVAVALFA
ncbi:hypothetical protein BDQ17DRAFT_1424918 [Cyathus striatus]|nr:hypothetical protein BDQ17DRAFT_1424918 [Cyathus striatus]